MSKKQKRSKTRKCPCCDKIKPLSEFPNTPHLDKLLDTAGATFFRKTSDNMSHEKIVDLTFEVAGETLQHITVKELLQIAIEDEEIATEEFGCEDVLDGHTCVAEAIHNILMGKVAWMLHQVHVKDHPGSCNCELPPAE